MFLRLNQKKIQKYQNNVPEKGNNYENGINLGENRGLFFSLEL